MKKIQALALLPVIALASCGKSEEVKVETTTKTNPPATSQLVPIQSGSSTQVTPITEESTSETLNENVVAIPVANEKTFEFTYKLGDQVIPVKGTLGLVDGKIVSMVVDGIKSTDKGPLVDFASKAPLAVLGKDIKGLKIDSISGASLTTAGFNQYLSTIQ